MPELIVTSKGLYYGGKAIGVGERFTATEVDANYLKKTKRAADVPSHEPVRAVASVVAPPPTFVPEGVPEKDQAPARRSYRRRDFRAED